MNLHELIENCHLDIKELNRDAMCNVIRDNYSNREIVNLIRLFLKGIGNKHTVPGNLIYSLQDIADCFEQGYDLSPKQQNYILNNIVEQWDQISLESRIELNL